MPDVLRAKSELRLTVRQRRRDFVDALDPLVRDAAFSTLPRQLWPLFATAEIVGLYVAHGAEAPTRALIDFVTDSRRLVALPRIDEGSMAFRRWSPGDPLEVEKRSAQPAAVAPTVTPDLLFVPLLAFDERLGRLGQGGGHYDRWLADHPDTRSVGLGWSVQEVARVPMEPHDRPLDAVLTERAVITRSVPS